MYLTKSFFRSNSRNYVRKCYPVERDREGADPGSENGAEKVDEQLSGERIGHLQLVLFGEEDVREAAERVRLGSVDEDDRKDSEDEKQRGEGGRLERQLKISLHTHSTEKILRLKLL